MSEAMIVILAGGTSAEREVSLSTAQTVAESLKRQKIEFTPVDARDHDWLEQVKKFHPKKVVIALHGPYGEDGTVQKILDANNIPYTGSGSKVSSLTIDKIRTKKLAHDKCQTAVAKEFTAGSIVYPAVIKPNKQGSSYGVSIINTPTELKRAIELAKKYDEDGQYLIEEYIKGVELTCAVVDLFGKIQALPLVEIVPKNIFFDYQAKYNTESGCQEICPARIDKKRTEQIQRTSVFLFKVFGIRQYCRIDWILRDQTPYFLEINTLPGMTPTSLINKELAAAGNDYDNFIRKLIQTA